MDTQSSHGLIIVKLRPLRYMSKQGWTTSYDEERKIPDCKTAADLATKSGGLVFGDWQLAIGGLEFGNLVCSP
jgi:hypothetical protein